MSISDKELFYGWDIAAIWRDPRLDPIDGNLFIHLILITQTMEAKHLYDGSIAYEVPISLLVKETSLSTGGAHKSLQELQKSGYIHMLQIPGSHGKKCGHIIFTDLNRVTIEPNLLSNSQITPVDPSPEGVKAYQIKNAHGYGMFYAPKVAEEKKE